MSDMTKKMLVVRAVGKLEVRNEIISPNEKTCRSNETAPYYKIRRANFKAASWLC